MRSASSIISANISYRAHLPQPLVNRLLLQFLAGREAARLMLRRGRSCLLHWRHRKFLRRGCGLCDFCLCQVRPVRGCPERLTRTWAEKYSRRQRVSARNRCEVRYPASNRSSLALISPQPCTSSSILSRPRASHDRPHSFPEHLRPLGAPTGTDVKPAPAIAFSQSSRSRSSV